MKKQVFLFRFQTSQKDQQIRKGIRRLISDSGLDTCIEKKDLTAVKVHFGELGNSSYIPAKYIVPIVKTIRGRGARAFVTDTNVLYKSQRDNAVDHLNLAYQHGFHYKTLGAPVIIADGLTGHNENEIRIDAPIHQTVSLAADFVAADSVIVASHATGHLSTGLAATIKNMGMGMASRKGKLEQHSVSKPGIRPQRCTACGQCLHWCPVDAIGIPDNFAVIDENICIGCGECLTVCRFGAVYFKWDNTNEKLQQEIAEHALGIAKQKKDKIGYLTFLVQMTKDCDCMAQQPDYLLEDIGVLAGKDPVAIDQAVIDLTSQKGKSLAELSYPAIQAEHQLEYAERIGLGSREYELLETG